MVLIFTYFINFLFYSFYILIHSKTFFFFLSWLFLELVVSLFNSSHSKKTEDFKIKMENLGILKEKTDAS